MTVNKTTGDVTLTKREYKKLAKVGRNRLIYKVLKIVLEKALGILAARINEMLQKEEAKNSGSADLIMTKNGKTAAIWKI